MKQQAHGTKMSKIIFMIIFNQKLRQLSYTQIITCETIPLLESAVKKINMSACFVWEEIKLSKLHITRGWIQDFLKGGGVVQWISTHDGLWPHNVAI